MKNGRYITAAGSTVEISGEHSGISRVEFDWLEEGGCIDCQPHAYSEIDGNEFYLIWICRECGGGKAQLKRI